jgi:hypothetical protein
MVASSSYVSSDVRKKTFEFGFGLTLDIPIHVDVLKNNVLKFVQEREKLVNRHNFDNFEDANKQEEEKVPEN